MVKSNPEMYSAISFYPTRIVSIFIETSSGRVPIQFAPAAAFSAIDYGAGMHLVMIPGGCPSYNRATGSDHTQLCDSLMRIPVFPIIFVHNCHLEKPMSDFSCTTSDGVEWTVYKDATGDWRWRCTVGRHIVGAAHEGYKNKADCIANARRTGLDADPEEQSDGTRTDISSIP